MREVMVCTTSLIHLHHQNILSTKINKIFPAVVAWSLDFRMKNETELRETLNIGGDTDMLI